MLKDRSERPELELTLMSDGESGWALWRNRTWGYSLATAVGSIRAELGSFQKGPRFKTIMTSPGHERTGQTE